MTDILIRNLLKNIMARKNSLYKKRELTYEEQKKFTKLLKSYMKEKENLMKNLAKR